MQPISFRNTRKNRFAFKFTRLAENKEKHLKNNPVPVPAPAPVPVGPSVVRMNINHLRSNWSRSRRRRSGRRRHQSNVPEEEFLEEAGLESFPSTLWKRNFSRTDKTFRKRRYWGKKLSILKIRRKMFKEFGIRGKVAQRKGIELKRERKSRTCCKRQARAAKLSDHFQF